MAGRFSYSRPDRRRSNDPWFRLGEFEIGSSALLALACAASLLVYAIEPVDKPILRRLILIPDDVLGGQVWRIATWPLANITGERMFWTAIGIAIIWFIGSRIEEQIGRLRMTVLLAAIIIIPGVLGTALDLPQAGVRSLQIVILLIYIAEYPHVKFFFGIPAWALGLLYVVTDILEILGAKHSKMLLFYLVSLASAAFAARAVGLLTAYPWIPRIPLPSLLTGEATKRRNHKPVSAQRRASAKVVEGPWAAPPPPGRPNPDAAVAQTELDALLDKISATGLESLTADEKRRLNELSKRLR